MAPRHQRGHTGSIAPDAPSGGLSKIADLKTCGGRLALDSYGAPLSKHSIKFIKGAPYPSLRCGRLTSRGTLALS